MSDPTADPTGTSPDTPDIPDTDQCEHLTFVVYVTHTPEAEPAKEGVFASLVQAQQSAQRWVGAGVYEAKVVTETTEEREDRLEREATAHLAEIARAGEAARNRQPYIPTVHAIRVFLDSHPTGGTFAGSADIWADRYRTDVAYLLSLLRDED